MRSPAFSFFVILALAASAAGKCANRIIHVEGRVDGPRGGELRIAVVVTPDPNWEPQPPISVKEGTFTGTILFDSWKRRGVIVEDNCSRVPKTVQLVLFKDGREVNRIHLDIGRDFIKEKTGDYHPRTPIILHTQ